MSTAIHQCPSRGQNCLPQFSTPPIWTAYPAVTGVYVVNQELIPKCGEPALGQPDSGEGDVSDMDGKH